MSKTPPATAPDVLHDVLPGARALSIAKTELSLLDGAGDEVVG